MLLYVNGPVLLRQRLLLSFHVHSLFFPSHHSRFFLFVKLSSNRSLAHRSAVRALIVAGPSFSPSVLLMLFSPCSQTLLRMYESIFFPLFLPLILCFPPPAPARPPPSTPPQERRSRLPSGILEMQAQLEELVSAREVEREEEERHKNRTREVQLDSIRNYEEIKRKHQQNMSLFEAHKQLVEQNDKYRSEV